MARTNARKLAFWIHPWNNGSPYPQIKVKVLKGYVRDAAKQYDNDPSEHFLERLTRIRENSGSCKYFDADVCEVCDIEWQSDRDAYVDQGRSSWYGATVQNGSICPELVKVARTLEKLYPVTPEAVAAVLREKLKAIHVGGTADMPYAAWSIVDKEDSNSVIIEAVNAVPADWKEEAEAAA